MITTQQNAQALLLGTGLSLLDAARRIRQIIDFKPQHCTQKAAAYCTRVIQAGLAQQHIKEKSVAEGFAVYLSTKQHLRPDPLHDIRYLGKRLLRTRPDLAKRMFDSLSLTDCEQWLTDTFTTPNQFNKGRTLLHALFHFSCCRKWCPRNPIHYLPKKRPLRQHARAHTQRSGTLLCLIGAKPSEKFQG